MPGNNGFKNLAEYVIDIDDDMIREAIQFKLNDQKRKLSYVDCVVHMAAIRNNSKSLTGDRQFEGFDNAEFVK